MENMRDTMLRDGVVVVRGLMNLDEIAAIKSVIVNHFEEKGNIYRYGAVQPNAAVEVPSMNWVYTHPKVISTFREIMGRDDFLFTGHSDIHQNMGFGWHKDDGRAIGGYFKKPYMVEECEVYKMGFYMNDHSTNKDGFYVKRGSHRFDNITEGTPEYVPTKPGDAVIFDVRLTHRGKIYDYVEKALLVTGRICGDKLGENRKGKVVREAYQKLRGGEPKRSMFFTFGMPNRFTEEFSINNMERQLRQVKNSTSKLDSSLAEAFRRFGVGLPKILV